MKPDGPFVPASTRPPGFALIVVLGFLAILTILGVAFAMNMRVERLASRSAFHAARARQLIQVALIRSLRDLDGYMNTAPTIYYPETNWLASAGALPFSSDPLTGGAAAAYVSAGLPPPPSGSNGVRWIEIDDPDRAGVPLGRVAYLAANNSGGLDANTAGTAPERRYGAETGEIRLQADLLPDLADPSAFVDARSNRWRRFETLAELAYAPGLAATTPPADLFVFSFVPTGYLDAATGEAAAPRYIGGDSASLATNQSAIEAQFAAMPGVDGAVAARGLLDYVDADTRLRNVYSPATEPTPMINEVVVSNRVEHQAGTYYNAYQVQVECWYPFAGYTNAQDYTLSASASYTGAPPDLTPPALGTGDGTVVLAGPWTPDRFAVAALPPPPGDWQVSPGQTNWVALPDARLTMDVFLREASSGRLVDAVTNLVVELGDLLPAPAPTEGVSAGAGADDPRLNWDGTDPVQWRAEAQADLTPGGLNTGLTIDEGDGSTLMYVANRPLEVVGELGFLQYTNRPWTTFALLGTNAAPVLDRFSVSTQAVERGLVNINTLDSNVLASAFFDAPLERYPGEPGAPRVAESNALALAAGVTAAGPYTNRSDIARLPASSIDYALPGLDALQQEALVRNTASLLSPRENIFTVFLVAQSVSDGNGDGVVGEDEVMAESRAVVVVWRDPYPSRDAEGKRTNKCFVRFFHWLE